MTRENSDKKFDSRSITTRIRPLHHSGIKILHPNSDSDTVLECKHDIKIYNTDSNSDPFLNLKYHIQIYSSEINKYPYCVNKEYLLYRCSLNKIRLLPMKGTVFGWLHNIPKHRLSQNMDMG